MVIDSRNTCILYSRESIVTFLHDINKFILVLFHSTQINAVTRSSEVSHIYRHSK